MEKPTAVKHSTRNKEKYFFKLKKILKKAIRSVKSKKEYETLRKERLDIALKKTKISEALDLQEDLESYDL